MSDAHRVDVVAHRVTRIIIPGTVQLHQCDEIDFCCTVVGVKSDTGS